MFVAPRDAAAQFQGDPAVGGGSVSFPDATHVVVDSPSAIVNWTPPDGVPPTDVNGNWAFMPSGNTMDFSSTGNFAVLNRIIPSTDSSLKVAIDGAVTSHVGAETGGFVAFYTPNGLIIGPTAQFDVGSLMLTTLDPTNFMDWTGDGAFTFQFAPANAGSSIVIKAPDNNPNQINATYAAGSFVAMLAPRIEMMGNVRVDGSAAYVAAEKLALTINDGLFDIVVDADGGTTDANGIVHGGSTGGPASTGADDFHRIYMVAVAKNEALTMLLAGSAGFDDASSVDVENGQIILSAGYNVNSRNGDDSLAVGDRMFGDDFSVDPVTDHFAAIAIEGGTFTSDLIGRAYTDLIASNVDQQNIYGGASGQYGGIDFQGDVTLIGRANAEMTAANGQNITVGSKDAPANAILANGFGLDYRDRAATGGQTMMRAYFGSALTVHGNATEDSSVIAPPNSSGTGGNAYVYSYGPITIDGDLTIDATGVGGTTTSGGTAWYGDGGRIEVQTFSDNSAGAITVGGLLQAQADGNGGTYADTEFGGNGGDGYGGDILIQANGGTIGYGEALLIADGLGSDGLDDDGGANGDGFYGGSGYGGTITLTTQPGTISSTGSTMAHANGHGGKGVDGGDGGNGYGGDIDLAAYAELYAGSGFTLGEVNLFANGYGGDGAAGGDGIDGYGGGQGGYASGGDINVHGQSLGTTLVLGNVDLDASAIGGNGGDGGDETDGDPGYGGDGGNADGGRISIGIQEGGVGDPASAQFGNIWAFVDATGGQGGDGGAGVGGASGEGGLGGYGFGGSAELIDHGGTLSGLDVQLSADGEGGFAGRDGDDSENPGSYGTGAGGFASILVQDYAGTPASVTLGAVEATANGHSGGDFNVGPALFGDVIVEIDPSSASFDYLTLEALGDAPRELCFDGCFGFTDGVRITLTDGSLDVVNGGSIDTGGNARIEASGAGILRVGTSDAPADFTITAGSGFANRRVMIPTA